jgi:hypothetical protein
VEIDTFAWYKALIRYGNKPLILLVLFRQDDNPFLGTIRCQALDFPERRLIDLRAGTQNRDTAVMAHRMAYIASRSDSCRDRCG